MCRTVPVWLFLCGMAGCLAPVNLTYESATMLDQGSMDVQANAAVYYYPDYSWYTTSTALTNVNYGLKLGYGLTDWYTVKLRYEHLRTPDILGPFRELAPGANSEIFDINYLELESKISLKSPGRAFGLPVAYYSTGAFYSANAFSIDPRFYFTFQNAKKTAELSVIPKMHIFFGSTTSVMPGVSIGAGFSSNLQRWAFRPEIGWDGYLAFGAAFTCRVWAPERKED